MSNETNSTSTHSEMSEDSSKENRSMMLFIFLAFTISWISYFFQSLTMENEVLFFINERITKFGPSIAGLIAIYYLSRSDGVRKMLGKLVKSSRFWITVAILGSFGLNLFAYLALILTGTNPEFQFYIPETFVAIISWLVLRIVFGGGLGEEIGFRGFALPRLQSKFGVRKGALIIGLIWTFWHAPGWFASGNWIVNMIVQLIFTVSLSFTFSYIYNKSNGDLVAVILFHGGLNGFNAIFEQELFPSLKDEDMFVIMYLLVNLIVGIIATIKLSQFDRDHLLDK